MGEVFNPLLYGHPVLDHNFRTLSRILNNITSGKGIPEARIKDLAVTAAKLAVSAVVEEKIGDAAVTAAKLATDAVEEAKIKNDAVTKNKVYVVGLDANGKLVLSQIGSGDTDNVTEGTNKFAAEHGADITGSHEAATITNQGALAILDSVTAAIEVAAGSRMIYDTDIATKCTSVTLSSIDGDTDKEYLIIYRWRDDDREASFGIRPNNDSGNNYGWESLYASGTGGAAAVCYQSTSFSYIYAGRALPGKISQGYTRLYAKSGYDRSAHGMYSRSALDKTILGFYVLHSLWTNSASNITNLVFFADQAEEIAPGTHIEAWKRVD